MELHTTTPSGSEGRPWLSKLTSCLGIFAHLIDWCLAIGLVVFTALRYSRALQQLRGRGGYDLEFHINAISNGITVKHALFHYSTLWVGKLAHVSLQEAALYVMLFYCGAAAILIHYILRIYLKGLVSIPVTIALTATLMQITGLWLPSIHHQRFLGIGSPNVLHSPTTLTLKPFALLVTITFFHTMMTPSRSRALILAVLSGVIAVVSVLAKPNFVLAFVAGAPLACIILLLCRRVRLARLPIVAIPIIACVGMLYVQWAAQYKEVSDGSGIEYAPLAVASFFHPSPGIGILQFIAFPLAVMVWRPKIFRDPLFLLTFAVFVVAQLQYLLLAETGARRFHANFEWGRDIVSAILFPIVVGFAVREVALRKTLRPILLTLILPAIYFWHLWSGIEYFDHVIAYGQHTSLQPQICIEYPSTKK